MGTIHKIVLIASLVTISSGATDQQNRSNQATYSHSFFREDVPLSYQYSAVHNYVPKRDAHGEPNLTKKYINPLFNAGESVQENIQYAPLPNHKELTYETTARSPILKDNRYETKPFYTSVFRDPTPEHQQYEYKMSENSTPLTMNRDNLEPIRVPMEAKNVKPFTYKPHVNHNIKIHQSPHITSLNNYYKKIEYPFNQDAVTMQAAQQLNTGEMKKYFSIYQQALNPEQQATTTRNFVVSTTTENPKNSYLHVDTNNFFLPKKSVPLTPMLQESNVYLSTDPGLTYYINYESVPLGTHSTDTRQRKLPKFTRYNYVRFQPKNH